VILREVVTAESMLANPTANAIAPRPVANGTRLPAADSFAEIIANVRAILPRIRAQSDVIEEERRLPQPIVALLRDAGVFRMLMPKSWGGPELSTLEQVDIIELLSYADASVGWCTMIGCDAGFYSGFIEDRAARQLWPSLDLIQAGWAQPAGRAELIDGQYRVTGRWRFLSGSTHADVIAAGVIIYRDGEPELVGGRPQARVVIARRDAFVIEDVWHTTGLRGTASNDYTTHGDALRVPIEHVLNLSEPKREGPLWARPDTFLRKMAGIPLGLARRAIDDAVEILSTKSEFGSGRPSRELERVKSAIGEARMLHSSARSYVYSSLETQWRKLVAHQSLTEAERADVWLSRLNAFQSARAVVRTLYDTVGASAVYTKRTSLDRALRDSETMCQHFAGQRREMATAGGVLLGDPRDDRNIFIPR
jgi:alkylation response protein AidB-like acyl-CoA dehydrogenase